MNIPPPRCPPEPSDAEINRITPDPVIPPFGGGYNPLFTQLMAPVPSTVALGGSRPDHMRLRMEKRY
jgi:hypothetical protein